MIRIKRTKTMAQQRRPQTQPHTKTRTRKPAAASERPAFSVLTIVQLVIMAGLLAFIILMVTSGNAKEVDMSEIEKQMKTDATVTAMEQKDMAEAARNFSFNVDLIDEGVYWRMDDIMDVNELLIVKVADDTNRQEVISAVEKYLEEKTNAFDGYGTNQFALLSDAIMNEKGEYYFFGVSEDAAQWEAEFLDCIR